MSLAGFKPGRWLVHLDICGGTWKCLSTDSPCPTWQRWRGSPEVSDCPLIRVYDSCVIKPQMTGGCNLCQRCFNQVRRKSLNIHVNVMFCIHLLQFTKILSNSHFGVLNVDFHYNTSFQNISILWQVLKTQYFSAGKKRNATALHQCRASPLMLSGQLQ